MLLRRVLIRLLLLAVFFNTVIGMPAHEAGHLQQAAAAEMALPGPLADDNADGPEHGNEARACAWCLAHVQLGIVPTSSPGVHALAVQADLPRPHAPGTFVPSPGRWPFASRDPPRASS